MTLNPLNNVSNLFGKFWGLLTKHEKRGLAWICILIFLGGFVEMLGIGAVIPLLAMLMNNGTAAAASSGKLAEFYSSVVAFIGDNPRDVFIRFSIGIGILFILKNIFLGFVGWMQARWMYGLYARMSTDLFRAYLYAPYSFHLKENSSRLIKNIQNIYYISVAMAGPIISVFTEGMVVLFIAALLFITDPSITVFMIVSMGILSAAWYAVVRVKVKKWGTEHSLNDRILMQQVAQGLAGIKSIKVSSRQTHLIHSYTDHTAAMAKCGALQHTASLSPRLFIEAAMVLLVVILLLFNLGNGLRGDSIIISLAIFAMAAVRLMPSFNRIVGALVLARYYVTAFEEILNDFETLSSVPPPPQIHSDEHTRSYSFNDCIEVKNLSFSYSGSDKKVIDDISLTIPKNSSIGIAGSTGSGKTTLVDIILGLLAPLKGEILIDGRPLNAEIDNFRSIVGYIPQETFLCDASIAENVAFCIHPDKIDYARVEEALKSASLSDFTAGLPEGVRTFVGERGVRLSGGQRQRIAIARALYSNPEILIIDEGTSSLDTQTEEAVMDAIKNLSGSMTVIAIAHRITTIMHCDMIVMLQDGKITASGKFSELQEKSEAFRAISTGTH